MKQKRKSIVQSSANDWHTLSKSRIFYQNSQFGLKSLIFGQTIKIMVKYSGIFSDFNIGLASNSLSRKNIISKRLSKFKNTNFRAKKCRQNQSKIGTPKIATPNIDTFFKFWACTKGVNLWRTTVRTRFLLDRSCFLLVVGYYPKASKLFFLFNVQLSKSKLILTIFIILINVARVLNGHLVRIPPEAV